MDIIIENFNPLISFTFENMEENETVQNHALFEEISLAAQVTRDKVAAGFGYNEKKPAVFDTVLNGKDITLKAWPSDWAYTTAVFKAGRVPDESLEDKVKELGSSLGVCLLLVCEEGIILTKRSMALALSPGSLSVSVTEGVTNDDLTSTDEGFVLDTLKAAQRGLLEELGLNISSEFIKPTILLNSGRGRGYDLGFMVETNLTFKEILASQEKAKDIEGNLKVYSITEALKEISENESNHGTLEFVQAVEKIMNAH